MSINEKKSFNIGDILIGRNSKAVVIPEIGINHNGNLKIAKQMVDSAYRAGAKIIKHQTHIVDDEMCKIAKNVFPGNSNKSIYDIMEKCALNEEDEYELKKYIELKGMIFLSTPFSKAAVDRLERFGVLAYKIGSGELNNFPLVEYVAKLRKPMIVSTGMNGINNIKKAIKILEEYNVPYALLHTTNLYPTPPQYVRLGAMQEMMSIFPNVPIGLSDHTMTNTACIAAIALGASIVERHFTDSMLRKGPDIVCSMDENKLKELIDASNDLCFMNGGFKDTIEQEKVTMNFAFSTVVSIKKIKKGDEFTTENIWVKRPATGEISAEEFNNILGKKAKVDIENDIQIKYSMVE